MPFEPVTATGVGHGENIKPLAQAFGSPVTATGRADSAGDNVKLAGLFSTAPYVDPAEQIKRRQAEDDRLAASAQFREDRLAEAKAASVAALDPAKRRDCAHPGCRGPARKDSEFCRWHPEG